ncbi:MAG TPA: amino acid permease [Gemmatimonadaceae bacterium]|nr:amino acid permease [Gemmatimonadaceae bacterium]
MIAPAPSRPGLVRALGQLDATMIVVGILIGSGIFIVSAESARLIGAPGWLLATWALAGLMTIAGAQCCAELAAMMPRAGGPYVYLREAYGPAVGFLFGWTLSVVVHTGKIAAVAVAFASFTGVLVEWVSPTRFLVEPMVLGRYALTLSSQQLVAVLSIVVLTVVNARGLEAGKLVQNSLTVVKTAALLALIVVGLSLGRNPGGAASSASWWHPSANGWSVAQAQPGLAAGGALAFAMLFGKAMVGPIFSQSGWNNVTFAGGEIRDPGRNLPAALFKGTAIVVTLYLLANLAYVVTLPLEGIQHASQNRVGTALMEAIFGAPGTLIMAAAIMISTFGCNNGLILVGARVSYAMACDRLFFARAGRVNRRHVPAAALVVQGVWASLLTLPRTVAADPATGAVTYGNVYTQLLEFLIPADLVFFALLVGAVIVMRRKAPLAARPYRTLGYPVTPVLYIALAVLLVADLAYLAPATAGIGCLLVLSGIPVYLLWRWWAAAAPGGGEVAQPSAPA